MGKNKKPSNAFPWKEILAFLGVVLAAYIGYLGIRYQTDKTIQATQTAEARGSAIPVVINIPQNGEMPTPIPYGPPLFGSDFTEIGDGGCDKYDPNLLGYEFHKYYIQPSSKGLMAVCTAGEWGPQMSLEVEAYPEGDLAIFGYGVIIGWKGKSGQTTDNCTLAVKRKAGSPPVSKVFATQEIDDVPKTLALEELSFPLDSKPHKIRVVFLTDSLAVGYLDNQSLGEFKFDGCSKGKIGLVAWGTGETKVYFDNLRLNSLP